MSILDELEKERLVIPREQWGERQERSRLGSIAMLVTCCTALGAIVTTWLGDGGFWTFAGLGAFLVTLVLFAVLTFRATDSQVDGLLDRKLGGKIEGLPPRGEGGLGMTSSIDRGRTSREDTTRR